MLGKSETLSLLLTNLERFRRVFFLLTNLERFRRPDVTIHNVLGVVVVTIHNVLGVLMRHVECMEECSPHIDSDPKQTWRWFQHVLPQLRHVKVSLVPQ